MALFGLSLWSTICILVAAVGMIMGRWDVFGWAALAYIAGWILRVSVGNTDVVR